MPNMSHTFSQDGAVARRYRGADRQGRRLMPAGDDDSDAVPLDWFSSSLVDANGQRLHLVHGGDGPLVLLVHGFPESWYSWRHQLPVLADAGYHVVAISGRGYGRSSQPTEASAYRITELVADCVDVVHALGKSTATIIGHDWGAQVAWAAAWMRPDVFRAVAAMGVAFGGRSLLTLPGPYRNTAGDIPPSAAERTIGGPNLVFYREYLATPGAPEREIEQDVTSWLRDAYYSYSASAPQPPHVRDAAAPEQTDETLLELIRGTAACIPPGGKWRDRFLRAPRPLPAWLGEDVMDFYIAEFERTGLTGALNWYRNRDLNWELLAPYEGTPVCVPALYIEGDRDPATILLKDAVVRMRTRVPELSTRTIPNCGHWIGEEQPDHTNDALLGFLGAVAPTDRLRSGAGGPVGGRR